MGILLGKKPKDSADRRGFKSPSSHFDPSAIGARRESRSTLADRDDPSPKHTRTDSVRRPLAIRSQVFEWDEGKAPSNLAKHGVPFEEAASAFDDPAGLDGADLRHSAVRRGDCGSHAAAPTVFS